MTESCDKFVGTFFRPASGHLGLLGFGRPLFGQGLHACDLHRGAGEVREACEQPEVFDVEAACFVMRHNPDCPHGPSLTGIGTSSASTTRGDTAPIDGK
jgi:hypothetical protein